MRAPLLALLVLTGESLAAGEYNAISYGLTMEYTRGIGTSKFAWQGPDPARIPQGAQLEAFYGGSATVAIRLGELTSWKLRGWLLPIQVGFRTGRDREFQNFKTYNGTLGTTPVTLVTASGSRRTSVNESFVWMPLRYYVKTGSAVVGGLYLETGPGYVRTEQKVDISVTGNVQATTVIVTDAIRYQQNKLAWTFGLGSTKVRDEHQFSYGLAYQKTLDAGQFGDSFTRVYFSWTW